MSFWSFIKPFNPTWKAYDAGVGKLWISDLGTVDAECRLRAHGALDQRTDKIRGCTDFATKEMFAINDPGVIAHEVWHLARNTLTEQPTEPINNGQGPVEPKESGVLFEP